jgi:hypothetical protein
MPTRGRGRARQAGSARGGRGRGAARLIRGNTNRSLMAAGGSIAPGSQGADVGQSNRGRGTVLPRSASLQTWRICRRHTNADAGPSKRRLRVMIRGDQIYVGRTCLNPKILQHPLMALRPVMPLRTIVDKILMERWKEQQPIVHENHDCDYCRDLYRRGEGACGEPTKTFKSRRPLCIHYDKGLSNAKRYAAFMRHAYDENEAVQSEGYVVSGDSFDPSESSSSCADRYREQRELDDYGLSLPSRPADYMSDEDTSSDSGNGFENLCRD